MRYRDMIAELLARDQVVARREHPELAESLKDMVRRGELTSVMPGVYSVPGRATEPLVRVAAIAKSDPSSVFTRAIAAQLTYWPERGARTITATARSHRADRPGVIWERRRIPPELIAVRYGLKFTTPSLTALDLSDLEHTEAIDVALRMRVATLETLRRALELTPYRRGNLARWAVLLDSRSNPWSYPERLGHRLLRRENIDGWIANAPTRLPDGELYYIDIAFERRKLAIEIDGRVHASDPKVFESDRWRQNALVLDGWRVLRFTYRMMVEHPEVFVRDVRHALRLPI